MAIIGLGTDIIEIARIEETVSRQPRFVQRILTHAEQAQYEHHADPVRYLAKRFAAKEAAAPSPPPLSCFLFKMARGERSWC